MDTQITEVRLQICGAISSAEFDDPDGLAGTGDAGRKIVQFGNVHRGEPARRLSFGLAHMRLRYGTVIQAEHSGYQRLEANRYGDRSFTAAVASLGSVVVCQLGPEGRFHILRRPGEHYGPPCGASTRNGQAVFVSKSFDCGN